MRCRPFFDREIKEGKLEKQLEGTGPQVRPHKIRSPRHTVSGTSKNNPLACTSKPSI